MLIFDIETVAHPQAEALIGTPKSPANYRDPVKIATYIAEKAADELDHAPLDADLCTVRAIGARLITKVGSTIGAPAQDIVKIVGADGTEESIVHEFWTTFAGAGGRCCGYNILGFDLPVLLRRAFAMNVEVPLAPSLARYRIGPVYDLYAILYNWGPGRGLKWVADRYGMQVDAPGVDGSQVAGMTNDELRVYMRSELKLLDQLYHRMKSVYWGQWAG